MCCISEFSFSLANYFILSRILLLRLLYQEYVRMNDLGTRNLVSSYSF